MSFGGTGNNTNSNLPNLSITGSLPPEEKRRRWITIAAQCSNLINYADLGDNPTNINWQEAYRISVNLLQLLDSLDPERSQPPIMPPQHFTFSDLSGLPSNPQPQRIPTPISEQPILTYPGTNPPLHDITPKMPIHYDPMGKIPPPINRNTPQNYIFPRVQNTVGPPPKRQYVQISKDENTQGSKQLPNTTYSEQSYSIVSPNQMYSNDYNPTIRTPYPDVPYTEQVPKKKRDNIKTNTSEKKKF